ncbi:Adenylate/guanylate cyclase protein [Balamuthia mandrillaris]
MKTSTSSKGTKQEKKEKKEREKKEKKELKKKKKLEKKQQREGKPRSLSMRNLKGSGSVIVPRASKESSLAPPSSPPFGSSRSFPSLNSEERGEQEETSRRLDPLVEKLLLELELERYAELFLREEIDWAALRMMGQAELKELGIPLGPRTKLLSKLGIPTSQQDEHENENEHNSQEEEEQSRQNGVKTEEGEGELTTTLEQRLPQKPKTRPGSRSLGKTAAAHLLRGRSNSDAPHLSSKSNPSSPFNSTKGLAASRRYSVIGSLDPHKLGGGEEAVNKILDSIFGDESDESGKEQEAASAVLSPLSLSSLPSCTTSTSTLSSPLALSSRTTTSIEEDEEEEEENVDDDDEEAKKPPSWEAMMSEMDKNPVQKEAIQSLDENGREKSLKQWNKQKRLNKEILTSARRRRRGSQIFRRHIMRKKIENEEEKEKHKSKQQSRKKRLMLSQAEDHNNAREVASLYNNNAVA